MNDDYWQESKQTKIIYQRDGKHYVFDGEYVLHMYLGQTREEDNE